MEQEDKDSLEYLLEEYPLEMLLTEMATIIREHVEINMLPKAIENAGLHPHPHALTQRHTRLKQVQQLQELANRI
jgi:hypothetical protein